MRHLLGREAIAPSLIFLAAAIGVVAFASPADKVLGDLVKVVYVHGAIIQVALITFILSGVAAAGYLTAKRVALFEWSQALARTGLALWIPYVLTSIVTMVQAWGGIAWFEPRWVFALQILIAAPLVQVAGGVMKNPRLTALLNASLAVLIVFLSANARLIMHPPNPVGESNSAAIKTAYYVMLTLWALVAIQLARGLRGWSLLRKIVVQVRHKSLEGDKWQLPF